jgi:alpha-1,3-rhamnosyl/mannosyltransferase
MRVGLDARLAGYPGIGRFISGLWQGLLEIGVDVVGYWPTGRYRHWLGQERPAPAGPTVDVRSRPFLFTEQVTLPRAISRSGVTVYHSPHLTVPYLTSVPIVLTVHDLFPYRDAANARSRVAGRYYRSAFPRAVRRAAAVVAVAPFTARELADVLGVDGVHVVEHGIDHRRWQAPPPAEVDEVLERLAVPRPYLLYVGTTKRHKNLTTLLRAHGPDLPPLVFAGAKRDEVGESTGKVVALGRVPDAVLPALYAGARALVLPSLYEAVGFTALEAMACGTPVVCSSGGGLPETVGGAALLVAPTDVAGWGAALAQVTDSRELRDRMVREGLARAQQRSWAEAARRYLGIYEAVQ